MLIKKSRVAVVGVGVGAIHDQFRSPTTKFEKVYREGFRLTVQQGGLLIEAVDYHTRPLFLDVQARRAIEVEKVVSSSRLVLRGLEL